MGKEKAPCRYLHFEVDWDVNDGQGMPEQRLVPKKKPYRLELGLGPMHKETKPVSELLFTVIPGSDLPFIKWPAAPSVDQLRPA